MERSSSSNILLRISKNEERSERLSCPICFKDRRWIWTVLLLIMMLLVGILSVNLQLARREQQQKIKGFPKGHIFLEKAGEIYIEDYFRLIPLSPQFELHRLEMSTTILNGTMNIERCRDFYRSSVRHLHKAAPNLKEVELIGGYLWNPVEQVNSNTLRNELEVLKNTLNVVREAFTAENITIRQFSFDAVYVADREMVDHSDYQQLLQEIFDYNVDRISVYYMKFWIPIRVKTTQILLNLSFEPTLKSKPKGRSKILISIGERVYSQPVDVKR